LLLFGLSLVGLVAPKSVLEEENKEHQDGSDNTSPSRENVGLGKTCGDITDTARFRLGANGKGEPIKTGDAGTRAFINGL